MSAILIADTRAMLSRWLIHAKRDVMSLSMGLMQPLFFFAFGGALGDVLGKQSKLPGGVDYMSFYTPGVLVFAMMTNAILGGIPIVFDRENGFIDKVLSAPISRSSIVLSRFIYVTLYSLVQTFIVLAVGFAAFGVRLQGDASAPLALAGIAGYGALLIGGITALSLALAFQAPHHSVFFSITGFITTPVLVLSSAFVPLDRIPEGFLRFVATWNPLSHAIDPIRAVLCGSASVAGNPAYSFHAVYLLVFDALCLALAVRVIRRRLD